MQMLSSSVPCPRCGSDAMVTLFGATGADINLAEVSFACPDGHLQPQDVSRRDVLAAWARCHALEQRAG